MIKRLPLSKVAQLSAIPEAKLQQALIEAALLQRHPETRQLEPTPLGYTLEIRTLHSPIREIILLPEDFNRLIDYLKSCESPK